jgi:hypothetical protein
VNRKFLVSVLTVLTGLWIYSSCTKIDTTDLGVGLIPGVDNINTFDTVFDVSADNRLFADTTRLIPSDLHPVGVINDDPEFGKTEASLYVAMSPGVAGSHPFRRKDSVVIDSVVLSLAYSGLYGDSTSIQDFEVYQVDINGNFKDSVYRIGEPDFQVLPTMIGTKQVNFTTLNDSVFYVKVKDSIRTKNELRIKLDTAFGRQFVNYDTAIQYKSDSLFATYFNGLAIKVNQGTSPAKNALAYFNIAASATQLTFYCRVQNNGVTDTMTTSFAYRSRHLAGLVRRTPAHGFQTYLTNGIDNNDDKLYLQSTPGSYATVKIPGLQNLSNRVIHRAELIMEELPTAQSNFYTPPSFMFIDAINAAGDSVFTIRNDFVPTSTGGYDVGSLEGNYRNNKYIFNLSRYVQSIVTKKQPSYTLRVYAPFSTRPYYQLADGTSIVWPFIPVNTPVANGRVVVGGGSHPTQKMRLRIIYSKI